MNSGLNVTLDVLKRKKKITHRGIFKWPVSCLNQVDGIYICSNSTSEIYSPFVHYAAILMLYMWVLASQC